MTTSLSVVRVLTTEPTQPAKGAAKGAKGAKAAVGSSEPQRAVGISMRTKDVSRVLETLRALEKVPPHKPPPQMLE